jgi:hypothetical protein
VTAPAPPQQQPPPPGQPPPQQQAGLDDPALAIAVAAVLAGTGGPAVTVAAAAASLQVRFALTAAAVSALGAVLNVVMQHPPPVTGVIGAASEQTARVNMARRAQYVIAAARRVTAAAIGARAKGEPEDAAVTAQLARERRYYEQHQQAMWNRAKAAGQTDMAAMEHGHLLGWNTVLDARTSAECRAADGKNYYAAAVPDIGFPGAVHPGCRCFPGPAHPGGRLLAGSGKRFARAA